MSAEGFGFPVNVKPRTSLLSTFSRESSRVRESLGSEGQLDQKQLLVGISVIRELERDLPVGSSERITAFLIRASVIDLAIQANKAERIQPPFSGTQIENLEIEKDTAIRMADIATHSLHSSLSNHQQTP